MPSSTSSSNQRLPQLDWRSLLLPAVLIFVLFVGSLETILVLRGYRPNFAGSAAQWIEQRDNVDRLGSRALVLVGGSRMLLDTDLTALSRSTPYTPVQLAIDGSSFIPVLAGLAVDPKVTGTVVVDFDISLVAAPPKFDAAYDHEEAYEQQRNHVLPNFHSSENWLGDVLHSSLRSYADGGRPMSALLNRALARDPVHQYVFRFRNRESYADYRYAPLPDLYYSRAMRNLGEDLTRIPGIETYAQLDAALAERIRRITPIDNGQFLKTAAVVDALASRIESHGGHVLFLVFPESGYVREIDDRRFPRAQFWDQFVAGAKVPAVHFEDVPGMAALTCPDGSHLDVHDRLRFTQELIATLHLDRAR